ncbi:MAG: MFS transporter [Propionibacteriaceae bacterium]|jgi:MFS family permease|nr:MFS transporter [Propionibacteriaceae bacterium]
MMRRQPAAVWAIAFACVVSFMGIGLVDPILPSIAEQLQASETQSELLFTTYLALTGVAMFFSSWVSSRLGVKKTLLIGLAVVVVFAAACGLSPAVAPIIGFRAGWGIGNALFISTALSAMVTAAVGGSASAIVLYETALGIGMAFGPLAGGLLGSITWRAPFFGTATLMIIGLVMIGLLLKATHNVHPRPVRLSAPFRALRDPGMGTMGLAAFFYNMAMFTTLAFPPFALARLGVSEALTIGLVFFGWGGCLALAAVGLAPRLTRRFRRTSVLLTAELLLGLMLVLCAVFYNSAVGIIVCVILAGIPLGLLNTVLTECSMEASDLPRPVASSTYSGCRFLGGAIAPPLCTLLASISAVWVPFIYGALMIMVSFSIVLIRRSTLIRADQTPDDVTEIESDTVEGAEVLA